MRINLNPTLLAQRIESISPRRCVIASAFAIAIIGVIDHVTGPIVSLTILYLVPIAASAWIAGRLPANALALLAAITWAIADRIGPLAEPKEWIAYLNDVSMLVVFVFVNVILTTLRRQRDRQRDLTQEVQRHLLPSSMPVIPGVEISSRWVPAWTVAGDYYDVIAAGPHRVAICLADVSGKGMSAALIMSNVQATMRALAGDDLPPDRAMAALNRLLVERLRPGVFVTMFYGIVDTESGTLTFCSAGHTAAMLRRRDGAIERLQSTGPVAGIFAAPVYRRVELQMRDGDRLVVYSDGVTEYANDLDEEFGETRVVDLLTRSRGGSADETCSAIVGGLRAFGGARPYNDDVTILVAVLRRVTKTRVSA